MIVPVKGWAQSFQDTGSFSFTGSHNPLRRPILRRPFTEDGLKIDRVTLHPFMGVAEVFTDNVFRTTQQRQSDLLTTIAPGIQATLPFGGKHLLLLDYRAAQFLYAKFTRNNAFTQNGVGQLGFKFPGGLVINLQAGHVEGFDSRGSDFDTQNRAITRWRATNLIGEANLTGSRASIRVNSRYSRLHFKNNGQDTARDRRNASAGITGLYKLNQGISALLGVNINNNTYDENKQLDSFSYGISTGFELAPSRLLSGQVRLGYSILSFDRAPVSEDPNVVDDPTDPSMTDPGDVLLANGLNLGGKQQKRFTLRGNLLWRPTTQRTVSGRAFRLIRQSAVFNTATFVQTGISLRATQRLTNRLGLRGGFLYTHSKFSQGRRDNRFRWRFGLNYRAVQWLGFNLNYIFSKRSSTNSRFRFYSNTISISAQALF